MVYYVRHDALLFDGKCSPKLFLFWLEDIEELFQVERIPKDKRVQFVTCFLLKGSASYWWNMVQRSRLASQEDKVRSWNQMKQLMRSRFIPLDYCLTHQGMRSVHSYAIEFEDFCGHSFFYESEECLVERFLEGLQVDIRDRMPSYIIHTLPYVILLAKRIEEQLKLDFDRVIRDVVDNIANKKSHNMGKIDHEIMIEDVREKKIDDVPKIIQEEVSCDLNLKINNVIEHVQEIQVEDPPIIDMVLPIHIEDETIILKETLATKTNLVGEYIEQDMGRVMRSMKVVCYYKYAYFRRATNKYKKRKKCGFFRVSRKFAEKSYSFKSQDELLVHYKFHPPDKTRGRVFFKRRGI
ncbi:Transposon Ty3-G Gag-Pol polyprotein [Melia azedarach]|uniref:Transposon Ty3-G Gag-Pol polyprotein n=1 Tax=Melia azedarach TaxID=155640 RepID=A0ACC1XVN0_MELAZ|nr:Transposon Ty3-G Gag-Pol polyprotein [Melia azedarach]